MQPKTQCVCLAYFSLKNYTLNFFLNNFFHIYVNQNQPKSQILFQKNNSPRDLYTMTLGIYTVGFCKHYFCRVIVFLMISEATWGCCHHHTTTTVFSRLLKLLLLRHLAAAAASTLHPQSKFCFPGAQPCVLLQSSKLLKEKLKGLHGSCMGCLLAASVSQNRLLTCRQ